ncbi:FAD-dependent oxidoreductase [Altererythrobacter arenosus]|uniref:FAD-dependent oxidoreductase n=1 Tax=Altererythrobacter arenosus TaxID=3032592 RepID=UPI003241D3C3
MVGCGPAGLAAALALHRDGHRITLFERFAEPRPLGSGLMLQPSGMAVLHRLGVAHEVAKRGARIDALFGLNEHGRIALDAPYSSLGIKDAFGLGIHRASLFSVLFDAVQIVALPILTGHEVKSSHSTTVGRVLEFADGSRSRPFDLVVDASGWGTQIEAGKNHGLLPFGALWASLPVGENDSFARNLLEQRYRRASQMVGVLPIGSRGANDPDEVAFFWSLRRADHEKWRASALDQWKEEVLSLWPQVEFLLDRIDSHDDLTFARYAHRTAKRVQGKRLIRIGDAWHSASPQLGQGANMALLDAWGLALGLREGRTLDEGLRLASAWRGDHVAIYRFVTAAFTPMFQSEASLWPLLRDRVLAPLSRTGPIAALQARLMSGLFGWPLAQLGLELPEYSEMASSIATRASSLSQ